MNIWDTKGKYHTLDELCQYGYHTSMGDSAYSDAGMMPPVNGFEALKDCPELRKLANQKLAELGLKRFAFVGNGDFAIVLKTADNQVVRISVDTEENKRPKHPAILQPHVTYLVCDELHAESPTLRIEVLTQVKDHNGHAVPEISTDGLKPEHTEVLKDVLRKGGLDPHDLAAKNIALMSDGTPIVIDGGAVEQKPNTEIILDENVLRDWLAVDARGNKTWKQYALYPQIEKGEITGTLRPKDIERLKELLGEESQLYKAALEDGLYRAELGQIIIVASAAHEKALEAGFKPTFRETLQATRQTYDKISGPREDWPKIR